MTVSTARRTFSMYGDKQADVSAWVKEINDRIKSKSGGGAAKAAEPAATPAASIPAASTPTAAAETSAPEAAEEAAAAPAADSESAGAMAVRSTPSKGSSTVSPRARIAGAKGTIPFLQDEQSKVLEFWQIWSESIPAFDELTAGTCVEFHVSTSADMKKLTWRTAGPQNVFIQKMVYVLVVLFFPDHGV
jgi:hypothetical protein